jgi:hypothetical protein
MEQTQFIFTAPFKVSVETKDGNENVFLDGLASTSDLDLVDDIVTKNCLESMDRQARERNIKLDIEHEAFRGNSVEEKEINKTKIPAGRIISSSIEPLGEERWGWRIKSVLNPFTKRFNEIKGSILGGFLDAYSIAFIPTKVKMVKKGGKTIRMLEDATILNVATTGNPINTAAINREVFMKAINSIDEYKAEKESNPKIEEKLCVKNTHLNEDLKRLKLLKGGEEMGKEEEGKKAEEEQEEEEDEEEEEKKKKASKKSNDEMKSQLSAIEKDMSEIKSFVADVKSIKAEMAEIKALLEKPNLKGMAQQQRANSDQAQVKSFSPLDMIR